MQQTVLYKVCGARHEQLQQHQKSLQHGLFGLKVSSISHNLCWSAHISDIVARSKKIVGLIYRKFYHFCNTNTLHKLYLSLVRPILEYCCHIWDPFLSKDIELLESVQKFASKVCTKQWREPYNSLRTSLKLPLLKERRVVLKLSVLYKYLNGLGNWKSRERETGRERERERERERDRSDTE